MTEAVPSFMTIAGMALTYNISNGLAFGFILYPAMKLMAGRGREVSILTYSLGVIFHTEIHFPLIGAGVSVYGNDHVHYKEYNTGDLARYLCEKVNSPLFRKGLENYS